MNGRQGIEPAGQALRRATSVRLRALVAIRWIAVAGQLLTVLAVRFGLGFEFPFWPALATVGVSAAINLYLMLRPPRAQLSDQEAAWFLGFDILQLGVLLYLTGGLENPFSLLLLAPVAVAATILSFRSTVILCLLVLASASLLGAVHMPLPWHGEPPQPPLLYVVALWIALVLATVLIAAYAWRVAEEARRTSTALAAMEAALAREQRLSSIGALAAAAAHELGTPLGTITLIARELENEIDPASPLREDMALLNSEVDRCRDILTRLARQPWEDTSDSYQLVPVNALVEAVAEPYGEDGAEIVIRLREGNGPPPRVRRRAEVTHGLGNLIQNASQFAANRVEVEIGWNENMVEIEIGDDGPGFPPAVLARVGEPFLPSRSDNRRGLGQHFGLGIFIAKTLLEHSGAEVSFDNRASGGARVTVRWRLPDLQ
ncbi:MAG: ActS/PrrB/RegB family redox-sensitive histidine kinase [Chromatiales bacterium]|jgi:two-component system sensor histidine kinase RegB